MGPLGDRGKRLISATLATALLVNDLVACAIYQPVPPGLPATKPPGAFPHSLTPVTKPGVPPTAPVAAEYRLGVGDLLELSLFRSDIREHDDLRRQVRVRPDGKISYFFVGDIRVIGLTTEELRRELKTKLSAYIRSPEVAVILLQPRRFLVYVVGEVEEQGVRELNAGQGDTVLDAIFQSKGLKRTADVDRAYVIRRNALIQVDLGTLLLQGDHANNVVLQPDDIVYVPEVLEQRVFVLGYFKRPDAYEISRPIRLTEAIARAQDFVLGARRDAVKIIRGGLPRGAEPPVVLTVNVDEILNGTSEDVYVQRGDIVFATPTLVGKWNEILTLLLPTLQAIFQATFVQRFLIENP